MAPTYNQPSVEPIVEDSEDESFYRPRGARGFGASHQDPPSTQRHHNSGKDMSDKMPPARTSVSKSKSRKSHKSSSSSNTISTKHGTRARGKSQPSGQAPSSSTFNDRESYPPPRRRHTRTLSGRAANSGGSSESDGEGPVEDHREVLAATRGRLTSPSVFSVQTSLTTATNTSSGSSGSNSTVTQASISKGSSEKRVEGDPAPPSPAVPDPPDVFAYMENDSVPESFAPFTSPSPVPHVVKQLRHTSTSSASSSFHSDNASEQAADVDTDRSTSPERSVKGGNDDNHENTWPSNHENDGYSSSASAKYEAQLIAARERQSHHERGTRPNPIQYHPQSYHQQPSNSQALSPRAPPQQQPAPDNIPLSGYNLIAQTLASPNRKFSPIYRRFESLNHRVLLSLQDEIAELEDELKRLDDWDTNNRSFGVSVSVPPTNSSRPSTSSSSSSSLTSGVQSQGAPIESTATGNQTSNEHPTRIARHIHPSSRRHEARYPSDISYSKSQLLQTLQYKLAQYNIHLKAFDDAAQLARPENEEVEKYRQFLRWERPVVDPESRYIDEAVEDDLVVLGGRSGPFHRHKGQEPRLVSDGSSIGTDLTRFLSSSASVHSDQRLPNKGSSVVENAPLIPLPTMATALAAAFLIPILTFGIIPNWLGRMTVVLLVGLGVWGGVWQSLSLSKGADGGVTSGEGREWMVGSDGLIIAGVYGGVMAVVAAVVG